MVLECTSFVKAVSKIQNLVDVKNIIKSELNRDCEYAFLVTCGFNKNIKEECLKIAKQNNITIIDASDIL